MEAAHLQFTGVYSMGVKVFGGGKLRKFIADNSGKSEKSVEAGFFSDSPYEKNGVPVAAVAIYNEFGTRTKDGGVHIPERPFFRRAVNKMSKTLGAVVKAKMQRVNGALKITDTTLEFVGRHAQDAIQQSIQDTYTPPNAESTIKAKGSSHPLIDNGDMKKAVTWKVKK
jgi:hypothetical protein